jgi:hypothetical protein
LQLAEECGIVVLNQMEGIIMKEMYIKCLSFEEVFATEAIVDLWFNMNGKENPGLPNEDDLQVVDNPEWMKDTSLNGRYLYLTEDGVEGWIHKNSINPDLPVRRFNPKVIMDFMKQYVGKVMIEVDGSSRLVEKKDDGIQIGCTFIPMDKVEEIYQLAKS